MVEVTAGTETRGQSGDGRGLRLVRLRATDADEERVLIVEQVVGANVEVIPVLNALLRVDVIVDDRRAARIDLRSAIWLRESVQVILPDGVNQGSGNHVWLRAVAHERQASGGILDHDGDSGTGVGAAGSAGNQAVGAIRVEETGKIAL